MRSLLRTSILVVTVVATVASAGAGAAAAASRKGHRARVVRSFLTPPRPPARLDVPCPGATVNADDGTAVGFAASVMCLVNQERARHGLGALAARPLLGAVGLRHANAMVVEDFFAHAEPGGLSYRARIFRAGYWRPPAVGFIAGENIAWTAGYRATPQALVAGWMHSPSHRAEILDWRYREAGVGVVMSSPPSLNVHDLGGATAAMEFGALTYRTARAARHRRG